jgi:hypothetical protein
MSVAQLSLQTRPTVVSIAERVRALQSEARSIARRLAPDLSGARLNLESLRAR